MRHTHLVGILMIVVAALLGSALALGLNRLEAITPATDSSAISAPTPPPATPVPTAAAAIKPPAGAQAAASPNAGDPAAGAKVFADNCTFCHPNGNAGVGPALHGSAFNASFSKDDAIRAKIRTGGNGMPTFAKSQLSDADLDAVIAYLRSLK